MLQNKITSLSLPPISKVRISTVRLAGAILLLQSPLMFVISGYFLNYLVTSSTTGTIWGAIAGLYTLSALFIAISAGLLLLIKAPTRWFQNRWINLSLLPSLLITCLVIYFIFIVQAPETYATKLQVDLPILPLVLTASSLSTLGCFMLIFIKSHAPAYRETQINGAITRMPNLRLKLPRITLSPENSFALMLAGFLTLALMGLFPQLAELRPLLVAIGLITMSVGAITYLKLRGK